MVHGNFKEFMEALKNVKPLRTIPTHIYGEALFDSITTALDEEMFRRGIKFKNRWTESIDVNSAKDFLESYVDVVWNRISDNDRCCVCFIDKNEDFYFFPNKNTFASFIFEYLMSPSIEDILDDEDDEIDEEDVIWGSDEEDEEDDGSLTI